VCAHTIRSDGVAVRDNPAVSYYLNRFSPATYEAFSKSDRTVSGFKEKHQALAKRVKPGDTLLCYVTKLSRWIGAPGRG
jgi:predicted RNA-binding protein